MIASGKRVAVEFDTPEFFVEMAALNAVAKLIEPHPGSLGPVISEYRRSPDWKGRKPKTRFSYERALRVLAPLEKTLDNS